MPQATAMITFDADTPEDADAIMATWTLSEGCTVSASMMATIGPSPGATDADGKIVEQPPPEVPSLDMPTNGGAE